MTMEFNRESSSDASVLLAAITTFDCIVAITTVSEVLGHILQGRQQDVIRGFQYVENINTIIIIRSEFIKYLLNTNVLFDSQL